MTTALHGVILAGGKSSRMRRDKGSICYHGVDQVHHLKMLLEPYVEGDVLISIQREQQHAEHLKDLSCVFDTYAVNTPLNGIASAMEKNPSSAWLVIAVDMPNIVTDAIELLIKKRTLTSVATCFESPLKGGPDLLFAIWEPRALPLLKEGLSTRRTDSHLCPRSLLSKEEITLIKSVDPSMLANINTPEELAAWGLQYENH